FPTGLPNIAILCITIDTSNKTMYVGTDFGVYYRDTTMTQWEPFLQGLPNIEVSDLGIDYTRNTIVAATYGRGMWQSPKHELPPVTHISTIPFAQNALNIFPNPTQGAFTASIQANGWRNQKISFNIYNTNGILVHSGVGKTNNRGEVLINNP